MVTTAPVTIEQAAALLNVSASTIRRRIRAGSLQVTETHRPQGTVWLVHLPPSVTPAAEAATVDTAPVDTAPTAQPAPPLAQAEAISGLVQATVATVLGPLVGQLDAQRQTIERQADTIADLREERGRQSAELERAAGTVVALNAENETLRAAQAATVVPASIGSLLTRLWPLWAVLTVLVVAGALLLWLR